MTSSRWRGSPSVFDEVTMSGIIEARPRATWLSRSRRQRSRRGGERAEEGSSDEVIDVQGLSMELFAHDLRSPLLATRRAVVDQLDRSRSTDAGSRQLDESFLEALERSLERMDHLMGDILELASLPASDVPRQEFRVSDLAAVVVDGCSDRERVHCRTSSSLVVAGNQTLLERALLNLVENALRYTRGPVNVELRRAADGLLMLVDDHGPGVPPELREVIFEPLTRADPDAPGGSGLGLSLVRRVAQLHNGLAGVETAPTGGARFVLWVPRARTDRSERSANPRPRAAQA